MSDALSKSCQNQKKQFEKKTITSTGHSPVKFIALLNLPFTTVTDIKAS